MMVTNDERRDVARRLRGARYGWHSWERALYDALGVNTETAGLDMLGRLSDLIEPSSDALLETADENAAEYADAETMQDERDYRHQARIGNVTLASNNGYDLLDAMLEMGA